MQLCNPPGENGISFNKRLLNISQLPEVTYANFNDM